VVYMLASVHAMTYVYMQERVYVVACISNGYMTKRIISNVSHETMGIVVIHGASRLHMQRFLFST
jgi:hypothetical protein